jgi:hypothetical protein
MDSLAHLALMTKAQLVFAAPDTFLSFPALSPLSYSPDELSFASGNALSAQQLRTFAEFSRVTNSLPLGTIFQPPPDAYLWDKYHEVLTTSILASGEPSSDQLTAIGTAQAYLRVTTPDGLQTDSPAVVAYKQYRDAWFKAVQDYKEKQVTAGASTDPKEQTQWKDTDEPALRAKITEAEANWESKGNKAAVEQAQKAATEIASQSPQLIWRDWSSKFIPEIDLQTDPEQNTFALTGFLPNNAVEQKDWVGCIRNNATRRTGAKRARCDFQRRARLESNREHFVRVSLCGPRTPLARTESIQRAFLEAHRPVRRAQRRE